MEKLSSGLPELVADQEELARFLTQSNQFNSLMAKPSAFLPHPIHRNTSVFRIGGDPDRLRQTWNETAGCERALKGAAILTARGLRACRLDVIAAEPPPAHANIEGWPWTGSDPELQKAERLKLAQQIASEAKLVRL
jgi:hypothetical protein